MAANISIDGDLLNFESVGTEGHQHVLIKIKELMENKGISWQDISSIVVNPGPGSCTGVRIGIVIATFIAQSLDVFLESTDGQKDIIFPKYASQPYITKNL